MVLIEINGNYISMEPMRSRDTDEIIRRYRAIIEGLRKKNIIPQKQMLDNEAPQEFLNVIEEYNIEWELVPPYNHRRNIAERAIQTAKGHIIANMLGCAESFPMQEWHRLLPQIELTLNMLRPANVRQTISAHSYVYGIHDYNRMPLAQPLGCETQCFVDPEQGTSFGAHLLDSWHIGSSEDHYRAYKVFMRQTKAEGITDTIVFKHKRITNPAVSAADVIAATAAKLTDAIRSNMTTNLTSLDMNELERLADIFQQAAKKVSEANARELQGWQHLRGCNLIMRRINCKLVQRLRGWMISQHHNTTYETDEPKEI